MLNPYFMPVFDEEAQIATQCDAEAVCALASLGFTPEQTATILRKETPTC
jgi:hypothetical protein